MSSGATPRLEAVLGWKSTEYIYARSIPYICIHIYIYIYTAPEIGQSQHSV